MHSRSDNDNKHRSLDEDGQRRHADSPHVDDRPPETRERVDERYRSGYGYDSAFQEGKAPGSYDRYDEDYGGPAEWIDSQQSMAEYARPRFEPGRGGISDPVGPPSRGDGLAEDVAAPSDGGSSDLTRSPARGFGPAGGASQWSWQSATTHWGRGPRNYKRSDTRIFEDVCDALTDHPQIDASAMSVNVSEGAVTIDGEISSSRLKHLAEDVAYGCPGVVDVNNRLQVPHSDWRESGPTGGSSG